MQVFATDLFERKFFEERFWVINMYFLITVDTEGDNLWAWHEGQPITTQNTMYIPRFQEMCEEFGFIPTYLTNYEMAMDPEWVKYGRKKAQMGKCEIGMHIHAWNSPPKYDLPRNAGGNSYITEYPAEIIDQKVGYLADNLSELFEVSITSNRSGRWATNETFFEALKNHGVKVDCSVTPELDLSGICGYSKNCGNDYRKASRIPYEILPGLLEIPMTTRLLHTPTGNTLKAKLWNLIKGKELWFRPIQSFEDTCRLVKTIEKEGNSDYMEYMIHSSELMPGGSPYFKNEDAVEKMYENMERLFSLMSRSGYIGISLSDYAEGSKNE